MAKTVIWVLLAALNCFGQTVVHPPAAGEFPQIVWPKSAVTVVFAPDLGQAGQAGKAERPVTLESWMRNPTPLVPARHKSSPVEFAAPKGAVGIRVGAESATGTTVAIGDDGKRHVECALLPDATAKLKRAVSAPHSARAGSDK